MLTVLLLLKIQMTVSLTCAKNIIILIIGTTAPFGPKPSSEASARCPYSLQHSSNFSPPASWHFPSRANSQVLKSFRRSPYFGQSGHCFFRFRNNIFFRSRLSALLPTPSNPGGPIGLLHSLGLHHGPVWHGRPCQ